MINRFDEYVIKIIHIWLNKNKYFKIQDFPFMYLIYLGVFPCNINYVIVSKFMSPDFITLLFVMECGHT